MERISQLTRLLGMLKYIYIFLSGSSKEDKKFYKIALMSKVN